MVKEADAIPSLYSLRHLLVDRFETVIQRLNTLADSYDADPQPMWALNNEASPTWLRDVLLDVWYQDGQPGNQSRQHIGLIGATEKQLALVHAVNEAKHQFSETIQALKEASPKAMRDAKKELDALGVNHRRVLNYATLGRLHLKQTWRRLPVAEERLLRVHMSWYRSGRSIHRITVAEAEAQLADFDNDTAAHIEIQRRHLAGIPSSEPLAKVYEQSPIMRYNLFFETPTIELKMRKALSVSMPLFVPLMPGETLPMFNCPPPRPPEKRTRTVRADMKLEDQPFLPSLHVYRYKVLPDR